MFPQMRRRKRKLKFNKTPFFIIALLIIGWLSFRFLTFKNVIFEPSLTSRPSIPDQISYFFNRQGLARKLFTLQPQFVKATFKPNYFNSTLTIKLEEEKIVANICGDQCYLLGEHGYIFKTTNDQQPATNNQGLTAPADDYFSIHSHLKIYENSILNPKIILALSKIFEFSNLQSLPLQQAEILSNQDLSITTKVGWHFFIDPNQNIEKQIKKLNYFLDNKKEALTSLRYLDLRLPQKIYYK